MTDHSAAPRPERNAAIERMFKARGAIVQHIKETGEKVARIDCPNCDGTLGYAQAHNGHIHARCSTEGCTQWME